MRLMHCVPRLVLTCVFIAGMARSVLAAPPACRVSTLGPADSWKDGALHLSLDVDGDGVLDALTVQESHGSGSSSRQARMVLSQGKRVVEASATWDFHAMAAYNPVPPSLVADPALRQAFENALHTQVCLHADPSLERLLDPKGPLRWYPGTPVLPQNYTLYVDDPIQLRALKRRGVGVSSGAVWLTYLGFNHSRQATAGPHKNRPPPHVLDRHGNVVLLGTAHGVVVQKDGRFAWVYVHPGGSKLRRPSIDGATFAKDTVRIRWSNALASRQGQVVVPLQP